MEKVIRIDNGIHDRSYLINLTTQNSGDQYQIQVKSLYSDLFDHSSGNWGAYSVQSVHCRHR